MEDLSNLAIIWNKILRRTNLLILKNVAVCRRRYLPPLLQKCIYTIV